MTFSRYTRRQTKRNSETLYSEAFENRDVEYINQYTTPEFTKDKTYLLQELEVEYYMWKSGDKVYKLAEKVYGDPSLWWVICQFNAKPTESHFKEGDTILIPHQLEKTLSYMGV